jgi:hypothetical protein
MKSGERVTKSNLFRAVVYNLWGQHNSNELLVPRKRRGLATQSLQKNRMFEILQKNEHARQNQLEDSRLAEDHVQQTGVDLESSECKSNKCLKAPPGEKKRHDKTENASLGSQQVEVRGCQEGEEQKDDKLRLFQDAPRQRSAGREFHRPPD